MKSLIIPVIALISVPIVTLEEDYVEYIGYPTSEGLESPESKPMKSESISVDEQELHCLSLTLYKESRGESERGSALVAQVVINRTKSKGFRNTICGVVKRKLNGNCMFSFWCSPNREKINDIEQYKRLTQIAYNAILGKYQNMTTAIYFKRCDKNNKFFNKLKYIEREGNHCFFK